MTSDPDCQVLIVGAGPTGLVLAYWLTTLGVRVRIIDKTAEAGMTSRALGVQARTLELYQQVGLADAVIAGGVRIAGINLWVRGAPAARVPLEDIGAGLSPYPYVLVFPQDAHEKLLSDRLAALDVRVERRTELMRFDQSGDAVRAGLRRPDGSDERCQVAYLAGCDGARSPVREALAIGFPGGTYSHLFYVADVEATGPTTNHELHVDLDETDLLAVFPLRESGRVRLVGTLRDATPDSTAPQSFNDVSDRAMRQLALQVTKVNWFSTYRVHHRVAHRFRSGRVFLLGDAAHIHSPVGAQGMNTGIGDAINLAWKLAAALQGGAGDDLLDTYEPERIAFARRLVATTDRIFTLASSPGPGARLLRSTILPIVAPFLLGSGAFRRFLFRTVSQIDVNYRGMRLSDGIAGTVHGGDRLPWVPMGPGQDNFGPLSAVAWQVHVYGTPPAQAQEVCTAVGSLLHVFPWTAEAARAGLARDALYLLRPDGYVALASTAANAEVIRQYVAERHLGPRLGVRAPA